MFSITVFFLPDHEYNALESAIYAPMHRVAWCLAIGWVMLACITQNAGNLVYRFENLTKNHYIIKISALVNGFLTLKIFSPLSKLTYCAYLVNGIIELYSFGTLRDPVYMSVYNLVSILEIDLLSKRRNYLSLILFQSVLVVAHVILSYTLAFIVCVLFESPIHGLEKILLRRGRCNQFCLIPLC